MDDNQKWNNKCRLYIIHEANSRSSFLRMPQQTYEDRKRLAVYRQKDCELGLSQGKRVLSLNLSKSVRLYTLLQHTGWAS